MKQNFFLLLIISFTVVNPQNNLPRNFKSAYDKNTRSLDGKPGTNYWQNKSDYKIKAELYPETRLIMGSESIIYFNNSPDTLKKIVLRLYPDLYRKGNERDFEIDPSAITNGTEIKSIKIFDKEIQMTGGKDSPSRIVTNLIIPLEKNLPPKQKIEINIDWNFTIANQSQIRTGAYDSTSFFVAYWYPQVAVYDDIDGWDTQNYTGQTEMYNDFNNYEVEISLPKNFLCWSTGVLQNPEETFSKNIFEKYKKALTSDEIINVVDKNDYENGMITADNEKIIYKVKAEQVPDFAFAVSDHYLWDASSLVVDKNKNDRVLISAAYNIATNDFSTVADVARKAIDYFSNRMPGVPYPYPAMTVFNGQGGMEFPMMCNDTAVPEVQGTVHLTSHEISHTYFPFYMGINERKYAWMDEGWATMLPFDFQTENAPGYDPRARNAGSYSEFAGSDVDIPPIIPSHQLRGPSYRTASYRRPGAAYEILRQFLGDEIFRKALHEYFDRWNGKHPTPYDFFYTFNNVSKENLNWFWNPWFFEHKYPDLAIKDVNLADGNIKFVIENIGGLPLPIVVKMFYEDGSNENVINKNASIWKNSKGSIEFNVPMKKKIIKVELGTKQIPDTDNLNNIVFF